MIAHINGPNPDNLRVIYQRAISEADRYFVQRDYERAGDQLRMAAAVADKLTEIADADTADKLMPLVVTGQGDYRREF